MCVYMQGCSCRTSGHILRAWQPGTLPLSIISLCSPCLLLNQYIRSQSRYQFALYFTVKTVTLKFCTLLKKYSFQTAYLQLAPFSERPSNFICWYLLWHKWWAVGPMTGLTLGSFSWQVYTDNAFWLLGHAAAWIIIIPSEDLFNSCPFSAHCQRS